MNNKDKEYVYMTGQFSITINRKRETHLDGTPFTDRQMVEASIPHIRHSMHERGAAPENSRYHIAGEPTLLTKDAVKTLLIDDYAEGWKKDLEQALKDESPEGQHWQETCQKQIYDSEQVETYDEAIEFYREFIYNWEPRPIELFETLIKLFVEN